MHSLIIPWNKSKKAFNPKTDQPLDLHKKSAINWSILIKLPGCSRTIKQQTKHLYFRGKNTGQQNRGLYHSQNVEIYRKGEENISRVLRNLRSQSRAKFRSWFDNLKPGNPRTAFHRPILNFSKVTPKNEQKCYKT